jgi:hypothetical protein
MKQLKYVILATVALFVLASVVVVSAQGPMPPQGTPPAGRPPQGQRGQGEPPQGNQPMPGDWTGVVQAVTSSSLTVLRANNETFTAIISSTTRIELMVSQNAGTVSDIQVGNNVMIEGRRNSDGSVVAARIMVEPSGTRVAGAVSAVSGTTITLTDRNDTVTIVTTTSTKFLKGRDTASLPGVTKGAFVTVYGAKQSDGSISATYVLVNDGFREQGQGQPPQGQPPQGQPTRNQTPPAQPTRNQTPPPQPTRNQTPMPPPGSGTRPTPQPEEFTQSGQGAPAGQQSNLFGQFVQWLVGLFTSR